MDAAIAIILVVIVVGIAMLMSTQSVASVQSEDRYKAFMARPGTVEILNKPVFELKTECKDSGDMNKCEYFKYTLDTKELGIKYNNLVDMIVMVGLKGQAMPVSYVYKGEDRKSHTIEAGAGAVISFQQVLYSSRPPLLNFSGSLQYTGPLWNRQFIKVGEYTIFPSTWLIAGFFREKQDITEKFANLAGFRSKYIISCGKDGINPGEFTTIDLSNGGTKKITLCNGNIEIAVGPDAIDNAHSFPIVPGSVYEEFKDCHGIDYTDFGYSAYNGIQIYGYSAVSDTLGSNPELGKICCIKIKAGETDRKTEYGEPVIVSFYRLGYDDDGDGRISNAEKNFDEFEKKCSGKNWNQDDYCTNRGLGTQTFFAEIGQTTYSEIPKGC
ncbi:MAG: hypothetical protein HZB65_04165 [Candidatus Aenigmarchaeota archaeon]|nr:hypothetical protein [Candidatus Aenigmarchaeota archaeon]